MIDLTGESIMSDFELAMRRAIKEIFPQTKQLTCWFHFCQAAKKRAMQRPQLVQHLLYGDNFEAKSIYYKLLSLPLLPAKDIVNEFKKLKILALANHRKYFAYFIEYFERQWIKKVWNNCELFFLNHPFNAFFKLLLQEGPAVISVFKMFTRTTGALESYNGTLGRKIVKHGHFFKFVKVLIDEEFEKCRQFYSLLRGRDDKPPKAILLLRFRSALHHTFFIHLAVYMALIISITNKIIIE